MRDHGEWRVSAAAGSFKGWKETKLWAALSGRGDAGAEEIRALLVLWMPDIEAIIGSGGSSPTDFTLHDERHAFRVAQRMVDIIPAETLPKLSIYEVALLLLSAYLHDIGMTPPLGKVRGFHDLLLTGASQGLTHAELADFQQWLDEEETGTTPPIVQSAPSLDDLARARRIVTYYTRARHNDWSEHWIRDHEPNRGAAFYAGWVEDLVLVCRSHHYGRHELVQSKFDPDLRGSDGEIVHLRYLACVLRLADILEFDPERTPPVLLEHRSIAETSLIYWHQDHQITLRTEDRRLILRARPSQARLHRAIEQLFGWIADELYTCQWLDAETHFHSIPGLRTPQTHYDWLLEPSPHTDLRPRENTYVYIDGSFRPDTRKLLELLAGTALYGNRLAAVRELLQNAFDAVKERIAYERLSRDEPADSTWEIQLGNLHRVELRLEIRGNDTWLICADDGIGMTKRIVTDYLLVSGRSRRGELAQLDRQCHAAGFKVNRTGQFGVGVLSYFMLADQITFVTRRSQEAPEAEVHGWRFETDGVGGFGELRADSTVNAGMQLELRLRDIAPDKAQEFWAELVKYILDTIVWTPCMLILDGRSVGNSRRSIGVGWTRTIDEWHPPAEKQYQDHLITMAEGCSREYREAVNEVIAHPDTSVAAMEREGELPNGLGRYRISLPFFRLATGVSIALLPVPLRELSVVRSEYYNPGREHSTPNCCPIEVSGRWGWKGVRVDITHAFNSEGELGLQSEPPGHVGTNIGWSEVDIRAEVGEINVARRRVHIQNPALNSIERCLRENAKKLATEFLSTNRDSPYHLLNCILLGQSPRDTKCPFWMMETRNGWIWAPLQFPLTGGDPNLNVNLMFRQSSVNLVPHITLQLKNGSSGFGCMGAARVPDIVAYSDGSRNWEGGGGIVISANEQHGSLVPIWLSSPFEGRLEDDPPLPVASFPPGWTNLVGGRLEAMGGELVMNRDHPLVRLANTSRNSERYRDIHNWLGAQQGGVQIPEKAEDALYLLLRHLINIAGWMFFKEDLGPRVALALWQSLIQQDTVKACGINASFFDFATGWPWIVRVTPNSVAAMSARAAGYEVPPNEWRVFADWPGKASDD